MITAKARRNERIVKESDIAALGRVVVLLGETRDWKNRTYEAD